MKVIFETQGNRRDMEQGTTFVLNTDSVHGMAFRLNEITVYKQGKPLYINFATEREADTAKHEIFTAIRFDEPYVKVSSKPRIIGEAKEIFQKHNKHTPRHWENDTTEDEDAM